jgi:XTP/dITP diphosphohydrolase
MKICFATNNRHKIQEVKAALPSNIEILTLEEINCFQELPETSDTLQGNSLQKAAYVHLHYHIPCFADDTGLEVDALNGAPGVLSARYAGEQRNSNDNILLLLQNLEGQPNRRARFRTVFTLIGIENTALIFEGEVKGRIIGEMRGSNGFGYDPVFVPDGCEETFAEMDLGQKNSISHRAIATRKLVQYLAGKNFS